MSRTAPLVFLAFALFSRNALAAVDEETIDDPLAQHARETSATPATVEAKNEAKNEPAGAPRFHLDVFAYVSIDTKWTRDDVAPSLGEDVARARLRTTLGVEGGAPKSLRYVLEARLSLEARGKRAPSGESWPLERATYLYEALPTAAYVEVPLGAWLRARVGEQVVAWGRMDLASAADVLERRDLREPPTIDPTYVRLPTPTVRFDGKLGAALDATLAWTVVSMPHKYDLLGNSWAILGPGFFESAGSLHDRLALLAASTDQTTFVRVQQALVDASSPSARLDGGELAARAVAHVGGVDLGATYGWVRTKLPVIDVDPVLRDFRGDAQSGAALLRALQDGRPLLSTSYPRYHQLALDLEGVAGPLTLSWELGFTPKRPLYVQDPSGFPVRSDSGLAQVGVRAQYVRDERFVASLEADLFEAVDAPPPGLGPYVLFGVHRAIGALVASLDVTPWKKHVLDLGVIGTTSGPSLALLPRYAFELDEAWTLGLAAAFFPRLRAREASAPLTLSDVQVGRDFAQAFVRYRR